MAKWNAGVHFAVVSSSFINLILKVIILAVLATVKKEDL